jgi:hypothetical protein
VNAIRGFSILEVIKRFWSPIDEFPFGAGQIPVFPNAFFYKNAGSSGEVRLLVSGTKKRPLRKFLE